ncbi:MAG: elongation factor P hydroxylase [Gammaproteobacteria bacterium]
MKNSNDLITIFNQLFEVSENTLLVGGAEEPIYVPDHDKYRIFFRLDYFASALHEVAHWCLAGRKRRQCEDYGYWYKPDGRDDVWQSRFEEVEVRPQALECIFSVAAGVPFRISADNLANPEVDTERFRRKVEEQVLIYLNEGLPKRAALFHEALLKFY